jgi:hypothetical protein
LGCSAPGISAAVGVTASEVGSEYNLNSGTTFSVGSHINSSSAYFRAVSTTDLTGGDSHDATVVTQDDIQKAGQALVDLPTDTYKQQLTKQFTNGEKVIPDSFDVQRADAVSAPLVGAEAVGGKAKLTSSTTFYITAIAKSELQSFLKNSINKQISDNQRIYDDGYSKVYFSGYSKTDQETTVNVATSGGKVGPNIKEEDVKNQVKGKQFGDAQSTLEDIKGVSDVNINFSYFWVRSVPGDVKKIDVKIILKDA